MRPQVWDLMALLAQYDGLKQIALTTNGMLLAGQLDRFVHAVLTHINLSLDTLQEPAFRQISRRDGLDRVLEGIQAAVESQVKGRITALLLRDMNSDDCLPFIQYGRKRGVVIRFIEFIPLDSYRAWHQSQVVTVSEILHMGKAILGS